MATNKSKTRLLWRNSIYLSFGQNGEEWLKSAGGNSCQPAQHANNEESNPIVVAPWAAGHLLLYFSPHGLGYDQKHCDQCTTKDRVDINGLKVLLCFYLCKESEGGSVASSLGIVSSVVGNVWECDYFCI